MCALHTDAPFLDMRAFEKRKAPTPRPRRSAGDGGIMRLGIDVGGTNTDIAVVSNGDILNTHKTTTPIDAGYGVRSAIENVLAPIGDAASAGALSAVVIGTTHFTNAFIERRRLAQVAALRLSLPSNQDVEPMLDWPDDLKTAIGGHFYIAHGGYEIDGREAAPFDRHEVRRAARDMRKKGLKNIAVSSTFSTINDKMECDARAVILEEIPDANISLSSRLGGLGLIDRENAAVINASLRHIGMDLVLSINAAMETLGVTAPIFFSQNDGSLMSVDYALRHPALTFASGPANSMRGGARLAHIDNAIVVDIGGTTTDVGVLKGGLPREMNLPGKLGGVRTNFRMPDIYSAGLGGGSIVSLGDEPAIGPESVGNALTTQALVFGGGVLTATDIAVAAGRAKIGDPARVAHLPQSAVMKADHIIQQSIADAIDRVRINATPLPVVLVGGGRILAARTIEGADDLIVPEHADVANAVGAAFAQVSGAAELTVDYGEVDRDAAIAAVKEKAEQETAAAGADPSTLRVTEVEETPLPYTAGKMMRIRVKAVGELLAEENA